MADENNQPQQPQNTHDSQEPMPEIDEYNDVTYRRDPDETDEYTDDEDVPFRLPPADEADDGPTMDNRDDPHKMLTMPVFREPGAEDPRITLPGTGGLDPNPDMPAAPADNPNTASTVQNMRAVPSQQPAVPRPDADAAYHTMPNPNLADARYQRPQQRRGQPAAPSHYAPSNPQGQAPPLPKQRRRRRILGVRPGCFYIVIGLMLTFCGGTTVMLGGAAALFIPQVEQQWASQIDEFDSYQSFQSTFIYDRYGDELFESFGEGRRQRVSYERFPSELILATIAIEDDTFFSNIGIDIGATTVAFLQYVGAEAGEQTPGGSTITQQLVRNVLFDFEKRAERSVQRKVEEILLAMVLTQRRSKEDILEMYLNEIYYGNLAYGAQMAAQVFFGKDVENLTLGEAALLAGLPQAPADLDPLSADPAVQARVDARWREVLGEMVEEGYISPAERDATLRTGLTFAPQVTSLKAPHFTVYAQNEFERIMEELGYSLEDISRGGYEVFTTIDQGVNNIALNAARNQVAQLAANNVSNAAVIVTKPLTGEILGMVGSIDYDNDIIDGRVNVTTALRQPGSTMKPFTYAAAIERGLTPGSVIWDTRTDIGIPGQDTYTPVNYDRRYHGPMNMRYALANSYNIPAVQTLRLVGVDYLLQLMQRFGVVSLGMDAARYGLSLTLGGGEISLVELTNAYAVFANQGTYVPVTSILCIVDSESGQIIYQYENGCPSNEGRMTSATVDRKGFGQQVLDPRIAYLITDILSDNAARTPAMGSNSPLRTDGIGTAVKTGTTNDVKDNWTVGYTRNVAVGVWVGNNDGDPMVNSSGLTGAAPIWNAVITGVYNDGQARDALRVEGQFLPDKPNNPPGGMSLRQICNVRTVSDPSAACPSQMGEWFLDGAPGIPDQNGILTYNQPPVLAQPDPNLGVMTEISPSVYRALVFPIPENVAAGIQFQLGPGDKQPLPPRYCIVPENLAPSAIGAQEQVFIAGPVTSQGDYVEADRYARQNGLAILPNITCWQDVLNARAFQPGSGVTSAVITSPANGQVVTDNVPILGTVQFDPGAVEFWHLYIQGGPFTEFTPLGTAHNNTVANGQLETLMAAGLPSGTYRLRLALINAGDWVAQPYETSFVVP